MRRIAAVLVLLAGFGAGCRQGGEPAQPAPPGGKRLSGARVLMVIAPEKFRDEELFEPRKALEDAGAAVTVVSASAGPVEGMLGAKAKPDLLLKDARAAGAEAVVFVGGVGAQAYFDDAEAHRLAKEAASSGKLVGAICLAPGILARAGLLKGRKATAYESEKEALEKGGASWSDSEVVVDPSGPFPLVTANGPKAAAAFGKAIVETLAKGKGGGNGE
jgi:protease I